MADADCTAYELFDMSGNDAIDCKLNGFTASKLVFLAIFSASVQSNFACMDATTMTIVFSPPSSISLCLLSSIVYILAIRIVKVIR